jgi:hypothetical protein
MTDLNGKLYAGGIFLKQGGVALGSDIAMWDGTAWSSLGTTLTNGVNALTVFNGAVYAGTGFAGTGAGVSTWNGTSWSTVGSWSHGDVNALTVYNNELYAAAWGSGGWSGTGQDGVVAKWTGSAWSVIGTWVNGQVHALTIFNGDLYAGGYFADPSGVGGHSIAKWNGSSWTELGGLSDGTTYALSVYNDGACSGPALFAGGYFTTVGGVVGTVFGFPAVTGGVAADGIAKWDGSGWSALGNGTPNGTVFALAPYADGNGQALYVGGEFVVAAGAPGEFIAKWGCPSAPAIVAFGTGTPGGNGVQTLGTNGIPKINTSTFAFTCDNAPPSSLGLLLDSNVQDLAGSDPFFIGVQLHVNLMTASEVYAFDIVSDASGNGMTAPIPIPNSPAMIGATYYAQALWLWPSSYTVSPNNLSTSRGLAITVQP